MPKFNFKDIPIILVENSNNEISKNLLRKDYNVNCILTGENKGYSVANNIGLKLSNQICTYLKS